MAEALKVGKELPSLKALLERRGIKADTKYNDYQSYIDQKSKDLPAEKISNGRVVASGSMHVALGRLISTKDF